MIRCGAHTVCHAQEIVGGVSMQQERERGPERSRRQRRHARRVRRDEAELDESALTEEERRYRSLRRIAERKTKLAGDAIKLGLITALLLAIPFTRIVGVIILICGSPRLVREFYRIVLEPKLREAFIEREVRHQVQATLSQERDALQGQHARSMEQLSASIAHEIRNPITAAKSLVQQMGEDMAARENVEYAKVALEELDRVERSVSHLLRFARDEEMRMVGLRLADVIDSALETFRDRSARTGVRIERALDCEGAMTGDAEQLRRVLINLVGNALDALEAAGTPDPRIEVAMGENLAGSELWLRVRDNGPGIDDDARNKIFSPLYTSKANGTGLGLSISRKLVEAHGGTIRLGQERERGTEFLVVLPKQPGRAERSP
jgi:signal transduction histidine kinase